MTIEQQIDVLIKGRKLILKLINDLTLEQINSIPEGFNNNIGWQVAHLVVTQQLLVFKNAGVAPLISEEMINRYKKGEAPNGHIIDQEEWDVIVELFLGLPESTFEYYQEGAFNNYTEYTTSVNVTLDSVDKAIGFSSFHEGIHLGNIMAMRKLV